LAASVAACNDGARASGALLDPASIGATQSVGLDLTWENLFTRGNGARQVRVSPDGQRIAVAASGPEGAGIYRLAADDEAPPAFWVEGSSPVWFPSGDRIVFSRRGDLWATGLDTTQAVQITRDDFDERSARISPDGRSVAFMSSRSGSQDLWIAPADGQGPPPDDRGRHGGR